MGDKETTDPEPCKTCGLTHAGGHSRTEDEVQSILCDYAVLRLTKIMLKKDGHKDTADKLHAVKYGGFTYFAERAVGMQVAISRNSDTWTDKDNENLRVAFSTLFIDLTGRRGDTDEVAAMMMPLTGEGGNVGDALSDILNRYMTAKREQTTDTDDRPVPGNYL